MAEPLWFRSYSTGRSGVLWGLTITQWSLLVVGSLPIWWALSAGRWSAAGGGLLAWLLLAAVVVVPIGGRSAWAWLSASIRFAVAGLGGWLTFRSHASQGQTADVDAMDMPGALSGVEIVDGPPVGARQRRMAVIRNSAARTWAITARIEHDGIGMSDAATRNRYAQGLSELIEVAARGELIDEIHLMVRSNPDDCAEREVWLRTNITPDAPELSAATNIEQLRWSHGGIITEAFITVVVPEARLAREARQMGGALMGRMNTLLSVAAEIGAVVTGAMGAVSVSWLTSPELAVVVRTGFAPGDRASIIHATTSDDDQVEAGVPWAYAGPTYGQAAIRHYAHDAWATTTSTVKLPERGTQLGALAPILTPSDPGERRSLVVVFPVEKASTAVRKTAGQEFNQALGQGLKDRLGIRTGARDVYDNAKTADAETQLVLGAAMTYPYALCSSTVPATAPVAESGRRLDASIRRCGMAPQRLDMCQDLAFAAANLPLGIGLKRGTW